MGTGVEFSDADKNSEMGNDPKLAANLRALLPAGEPRGEK